MIQPIYRTLLRLYPWDFKAAFYADMVVTFKSAHEENRQRDYGSLLRFAAREVFGVSLGCAKEWSAKLTTDAAVRGRSLPDLRMMRPAGVPQEVWFTPTACERQAYLAETAIEFRDVCFFCRRK